jgi:hypothetical protein
MFHPSRGGAFFYYTADGTLGQKKDTLGGSSDPGSVSLAWRNDPN